MQPSLPFRLPPLLHYQFHSLPLHFGQQSQQGLDFGRDHLVQVHAASLARWMMGACQTAPFLMREESMNAQKLLTALMLMLPGLSWGTPPVVAPEPGILPLLAAGGIVAVAVKFMRRKK